MSMSRFSSASRLRPTLKSSTLPTLAPAWIQIKRLMVESNPACSCVSLLTQIDGAWGPGTAFVKPKRRQADDVLSP